MKNLLWKLLFALGTLPFAAVVLSGIVKAVTGFSGLSVDAPPSYGLSAFVAWVVLVSFLYWYWYIIGGTLIIISVSVMLWKSDKPQ